MRARMRLNERGTFGTLPSIQTTTRGGIGGDFQIAFWRVVACAGVGPIRFGLCESDTEAAFTGPAWPLRPHAPTLQGAREQPVRHLAETGAWFSGQLFPRYIAPADRRDRADARWLHHGLV